MRIRALVICLMCLVSLISKAQNTGMKFVGIPMDQPYNSFINELKEKGFTYSIKQEKWDVEGYNCVSLDGKFWKFDNCKIHVKYSIATDIVTAVAVQKDYFSIWYSQVYELMDNLDIKYGARIKFKNDKYNTGYRWISDNPSGMVNVSWCLMENILDLFTIEYFTSEETKKILNNEIKAKKTELDGL